MSAAKKLISTNSTTLTILSTSIRQDAGGRYCLNDCHKASGGEASKRPGVWMDNAQTKALIAELTDAGIPASPSVTDTENPVSPVSSIKGGTNQGTYVAKELVYAYAMWISPAFHLKVIRAFDAMVQGNGTTVTVAPKQTHNAQLRSAVALLGTSITFNRRMGMDLQQSRIKALAKVKDKTGVDLAKEFGWTAQIAPQQVETLSPTQIGQQLGIGPREANQLLKQAGLQVDSRDAKGHISWAPTDNGLPYARLEDLSKAHTDGTTQVWRWYPKVVDFLRPFSRPKEKAS